MMSKQLIKWHSNLKIPYTLIKVLFKRFYKQQKKTCVYQNVTQRFWTKGPYYRWCWNVVLVQYVLVVL